MKYNMTRDQVERLGLMGKEILSETESTRLVRVLNSFDMFVLKDDESLTPCLTEDGYWEPWITSWLTRWLRPGMTFLDIGANCGYYSLVADRLVGRHGCVVAYEPNPVYAELLKKTRNVNDANYKVRNIALSCHSGTDKLYVPGNLYGSASMGNNFEGYETRVYDVSVTSLDSEVQSLVFFRHDVVKIDAEGWEERIWNGGSRLWDSSDHTTIMMEYTPGAYSDGFLDELYSWGAVSAIGFDGAEHPAPINWVRELTDWRMIVVRKD